MPQLTYVQDRSVAIAGMLGDGWNGQDIRSFPASEAIVPGVLCEVVAGKVRPAQGTGQEIASVAGVAVYRDVYPPGGYAIGDMVPCLAKGRVWVSFIAGTGGTELELARVSHSSTVATDRGKFTDAAAAATAGSEVSGPLGVFRGTDNTATLALVELILPASPGVQA